MPGANRIYFIMALTFLVILLGYFSYEILRPFLSPISWAIVLSILFYPLFVFIVSYVRRRSLAAFITLCIILLILIVPSFYLSSVLVNEIAVLSGMMETGKIEAFKDVFQHPVVRKALGQIGSMINMSEEELITTVTKYIAGLGRGLLVGLAKGIGSVIMAAFGFILMALTLFFMLRDAPAFLKKVRDYMPFPEAQKDVLMKRVQDIIFSTMYGDIVVAAVQGTVGGVAFALLGIATPVVWGIVIAIVSLLPAIGPGLVWGPAAIYMFMNGLVIKGLGLVAAGIAIAAIDTFLRPVIIGNRAKMPFLIIFFSVIGGIQYFGFIGFILGPLVMALFVAVLDVFGSLEGGFPDREA